MQKLLLLLILLTILSTGYQKYFETTIPLNQIRQSKWKYMTKFGMDIGHGNYEVQARFSKKIEDSLDNVLINVLVYLDDEWQGAQNQPNCTEKKIKSRVSGDLYLPKNGNWSTRVTGHLSQVVKRHVWFFVISDCNDNLSNIDYEQLKLEINFTIKNSDGSQFPTEESGFLLTYSILSILSLIFLAFNIRKYTLTYNQEDGIDWAFIMVMASLALQSLSFLFELFHLIIYQQNGKGLIFFNLLGQIFGISSQFTITLLLIMISWGWTIKYHTIKSYDIYIPLATILGIAHMLIIGLGRLTDEDQSKYHVYHGHIGYTLILIRLALFVYFLFGLIKTYKDVTDKVKPFLQMFGIYSGLYFLSFPILVIISNLIAPYVRHRVISIGTMIGQMLAMLLLSYICTSKSSSYYKASLKSQSLLPSNISTIKVD